MVPLHICIPSPETASGRRSSLRSGGLDCKGGGRLGERPLFTVYRGISSCSTLSPPPEKPSVNTLTLTGGPSPLTLHTSVYP